MNNTSAWQIGEPKGPQIQYFEAILFLYLGSWLMFLTKKHYRGLTTRAGHIFELFVLLNNTIDSFFLVFLESGIVADTDVTEFCAVLETLLSATSINFFVSVAGTQVETAIFLRTRSVDTMTTNTAGYICLGMAIFSLVAGSVITLVFPEARVCRKVTTACEYYAPWDLYRTIIPASVSLLIVLAVMGLTIYSSFQFKMTNTGNVRSEQVPSVSACVDNGKQNFTRLNISIMYREIIRYVRQFY